MASRMSQSRHKPKGPNGTWKTGQRVPWSGHYADQFRVVTYHDRGTTFPPCIGRKGTGAYRKPYIAAATATKAK